jgi:hypothetical protein
VLSGDVLAEFKAGVVLCCAEMLMLMAILGSLSILTGHRLPPLNSTITVVGLAISVAVVAANFYLLRYPNSWTRYKPEFESYTRETRVVGSLGIVGVILLIFIAFLVIGMKASNLPPP